MRPYIVDEEARDVSRITGIPWSYERVQSNDIRRPCIMFDDLCWVDKLGVAFALVGGHMIGVCEPQS